MDNPAYQDDAGHGQPYRQLSEASTVSMPDSPPVLNNPDGIKTSLQGIKPHPHYSPDSQTQAHSPNSISQPADQPEKTNTAVNAYKYDSEKKALEAIEDAAVVVALTTLKADKPYAGMGKEDLLRFSQTPFWNRFRTACTIIFWVAWAALLGAVIGLTVTFPQCKPPPEQEWHETSIIYQIYVRSFFDTDGDGIGDIEGITAKLDYLEYIETDAILLSSIFNSSTGPNPDHGYEVNNFTHINPDYGNLDDLQDLLEQAHERDIKVLLEFIPNYTGLDHPWFEQSLADRTPANPFWNYYIWADCTPNVPNNWRSVYDESAWTEETTSGQCYLHQFLETQPELNLRSSAVQQELEAVMRYWLDQGVDGFRVEGAMYLFEDVDLQNEPENGNCEPAAGNYSCLDHIYTTSQDEVYTLVFKWRQILDEYTRSTEQPRVLLTEADDSVNNSVRYYGMYGPDGAQLPINFQLTKLPLNCGGKCMFNLIDDWLYSTPVFAASNWLTGSQNLMRLGSRAPPVGNDWGLHNAVTMLKLTLPGTAFIYYGEEIGMPNLNPSRLPDIPEDPAGDINQMYSRDAYRSPMQWTTNTDHAGFISENATGSGTPWLPVGVNMHNISVEAQNATTFAPLEFYRELVELRKTSETFNVGSFQWTLLTPNIISYYRAFEGRDRYVVAINFGPDEEEANFAGSYFEMPSSAEVVMTTRENMVVSPGDSARLRDLLLKPGDGVILRWGYVRPDGKLN